jgi:hypothetical protein
MFGRAADPLGPAGFLTCHTDDGVWLGYLNLFNRRGRKMLARRGPKIRQLSAFKV